MKHAVVIAACVVGCSGKTEGPTATTTSSAASTVGAACVPRSERIASFSGFNVDGVAVEQAGGDCGANVCLAYHFQGRVTCPYGQDAKGAGPAGHAGCEVPDGGAPVAPDDTRLGKAVAPQCIDRTAEKAVYCTCRCANGDGRTDDGATYCSCPSGTTCTPTISKIGAGETDIVGSYCIKNGTTYDRSSVCPATCDPTSAPCP